MKQLKSLRLQIGVFGRTNVGKSSFVNAVMSQNVSIVSDVAGTTTDIVEKSMELLPIGPVTFLDTAGVDDTSQLGEERLKRTVDALKRVDVAVLVTSSDIGDFENKLIEQFEFFKIPYMVLLNMFDDNVSDLKLNVPVLKTSVISDIKIAEKFKTELTKILPKEFTQDVSILGDLVSKEDVVVLVVPIDKEAPKGRLILPQVQTIRDLLDNNCVCVVVKETELSNALTMFNKPVKLVVTDSQAFKKVSEIVPDDIALTSFSILFARLKGDLKEFIDGANAISSLEEKDKVLILESCTHHAIEDDIARVKIPALIQKKLGINLQFEHFSGHEFPQIDDYKLIIHCGACMTNRKEVLSRILLAKSQGVPITNYGVAISYCLGILPRAIKMFL